MAAAALSGPGAALGADITFRGGTLASWSATGSWTGGKVPGRDDRAILGGTAATRINMPGGGTLELGSVWIRQGSVLTRFDNDSMPEVHLFGTDGVGVLNDSATTTLSFFRRTVLENDIAIRATNVNGGGFGIPDGLSVVGLWKGIDLNGHTLTFDMVNANNRTDLGMVIRGQGDVVKQGAGVFATTAAHDYTGRLFVDAGSVVLTGGGSFANASEVNVKSGAVFDASGITSGSAIIQSLSGDGRVVTGARRLDISHGAGTVFGGAIETTGGLNVVSGTQVLSGTNTYAGGTSIASGATLQLGNSGSSGSIAGNVAADGTLAFQRADNWTFDNTVTGSGAIIQRGTGKTLMTGDSSAFTGITSVQAGTLAVNGRLGGSLDVLSGARLQGTGIVGNTTNAGTIAPGNSLGTLTVSGNYAGKGGTLEIESVLGGDNSQTDKLVISGNTSGSTNVRVINVGGSGALTAEGIKVIDVGGTSSGNFELIGGDYTFRGQRAIVVGPYAYRLLKNGVSTPTDGDWYLRSTLSEAPAAGSASVVVNDTPLLAPTVPLYEAYSSVLQRFNELGTLQQRVGNRSWSPNAAVQAEQDAGKPIIGRGAWARVEGSNTHIDPSTSTTSASYNVRMWKFEGGVDAPVIQNQSGTLVVGPTFHYGIANSSVSSMFGNGSVDATGYGFGGTATWYGNNGSYVDARATVTWYDTDIRSSTLGTKLANGNRGSGVATSVEAGHQLALGGNWSITPQAQLAWSQVRFDSFTDQYGSNVSRDNGNSLVSRLGVSLDHETKWTGANGKASRSHVYGITNLYYDFLHGTSARVADLSVVSKEQALWAGLGVGASLNWNDDRYTVYGELLARTSLQNFGDSNAIGAKLGVRYRW